MTPQYQVERLLRGRAEQHGAAIVSGAEAGSVSSSACLSQANRFSSR